MYVIWLRLTLKATSAGKISSASLKSKSSHQAWMYGLRACKYLDWSCSSAVVINRFPSHNEDAGNGQPAQV